MLAWVLPSMFFSLKMFLLKSEFVEKAFFLNFRIEFLTLSRTPAVKTQLFGLSCSGIRFTPPPPPTSPAQLLRKGALLVKTGTKPIYVFIPQFETQTSPPIKHRLSTVVRYSRVSLLNLQYVALPI